MEYAIWLIIVSAVAVGVVSAVVRTWSLHSRLYSLEDRVNVLEGVTNREVKIRAAAERWSRPKKDEELLIHALAEPPQSKKPQPWFLNPNLKKGGYSG